MSDPVTRHYQLNLPQPSDSMSDVANSFNNAWTTIANSVKPKAVISTTTLPQSGYSVGDVIYCTPWKSSFILIATDPNWGFFWRPIHAKWSPWVIAGTSAINNTSSYGVATEGTICYRISNINEFSLIGGVKVNAGTFANGVLSDVLDSMPAKVLPDKIMQWRVPMHKSGMTNNSGNYYCKAILFNTGAWTFTVFNNATGTADANVIFLNGISWQIADRTDL